MLALFLVFLFCFVLCFCFLFFFLVLLSVSGKKAVFPAILVFFWVLLVKRVVWFLWFMCLFLFVFLVLFLSSLKNSFVLFCFCVVVFCHMTKWSFLFASYGPSSFFVFWLFCFEFCLFFVFSFLSKKDPPKNRTQHKPKKAKVQKKRTVKKKNSAIVFTNSVL